MAFLDGILRERDAMDSRSNLRLTEDSEDEATGITEEHSKRFLGTDRLTASSLEPRRVNGDGRGLAPHHSAVSATSPSRRLERAMLGADQRSPSKEMWDLEKVQPSATELRAQNVRLQAKVDSLMQEQTKIVEENSRLHTELAENRGLAESLSKYETLQENLHRTKETLRTLQQDVRRLASAKASDAAQHHAVALSFLDSPIKDYPSGREEIESLRQQLKDARSTLMKQQETSHRLVQQLEGTIAEQYQLAARNSADRTAEILRLQRDLSALKQENERLCSRASESSKVRVRAEAEPSGRMPQSTLLLQTRLSEKESEVAKLARALDESRKAHLHALQETERDLMRRLTSGKVSKDKQGDLDARLKHTRQAMVQLETLIIAHAERYPDDALHVRPVPAAPEGSQSKAAKKKPWK